MIRRIVFRVTGMLEKTEGSKPVKFMTELFKEIFHSHWVELTG